MKAGFALLALVAVAGAAPPPAPGGWDLVWSDEFDGSQIDPAKWGFETDCWGGGNDERQCYTDSARNTQVAGGVLAIMARRERSSGPALPAAQRASASHPGARATREYSSARLTTRGKGAWRFGRVEVRARLPQGQGTWPAIWMLPEKDNYGAWASSGEIDILEAVNLGVTCKSCQDQREDTILGTLHFGKVWPGNKFASTEVHYPPVLGGFHTFAVVWEPAKMTWRVDGRIYAERSASEWFSGGSQKTGAPFDQPFYLILNLAIGGHLSETRGQNGVDAKGFPKRFEIDWVRVWHKRDDLPISQPTGPGRGE